jgi:hypothetical protein
MNNMKKNRLLKMATDLKLKGKRAVGRPRTWRMN